MINLTLILLKNNATKTITEETLANRFDKTSKDIDKIMNNIEQRNNTLGKLLNEDSLYVNINGVALDLRDLIKDVKENPAKYMKAYFQGKK